MEDSKLKMDEEMVQEPAPEPMQVTAGIAEESVPVLEVEELNGAPQDQLQVQAPDQMVLVEELNEVQVQDQPDTGVPAPEAPSEVQHVPGPEAPMPAEEQEQAPVDPVEVIEPGAIWEPADPDVLSGRGASVNAHPGNKKFRAFCFSRKHLFEAGNHAAKRRIASEIVQAAVTDFGARFLKRKQDKGPWYEMNEEQALLKACQVMRDHKRPDRLAQREMLAAHGKKRNRATSTPMDDVPVVPVPEEPIVENPFGVHDHDILSGRGAFVNGHIGNARLRELAQARKKQFDAGNYTEKRTLAMEVVTIIRSLEPPGRFLRRVDPSTKTAATCTTKSAENQSDEPNSTLEAGWEELSDEKAIHKACQVMRDIDRSDRKDREERRKFRKLKKEGKVPETPEGTEGDAKAEEQVPQETDLDVGSMEMLADTTVGASQQVVEEAVAAAEEAMDKALEAAAEVNKATAVAVEEVVETEDV
jgi:hypothetical protein